MPSNRLILVALFSSCPQSFPASGSFPVSQFFASGGIRWPKDHLSSVPHKISRTSVSLRCLHPVLHKPPEPGTGVQTGSSDLSGQDGWKNESPMGTHVIPWLPLQLTRKELPRLNGDKGAPQPGHSKIIVDSLRWETKVCLTNLPCPMRWPFALTIIKCPQLLSHVRLFVTPWTVACQAPLTMGFPRREYWSRLPFSPPGDLPDPGIQPVSPASPALAGRFFTTEPLGKPITKWNQMKTPELLLHPPHGMTQGPCLVCGYHLGQRGSRPHASSQMVPLL